MVGKKVRTAIMKFGSRDGARLVLPELYLYKEKAREIILNDFRLEEWISIGEEMISNPAAVMEIDMKFFNKTGRRSRAVYNAWAVALYHGEFILPKHRTLYMYLLEKLGVIQSDMALSRDLSNRHITYYDRRRDVAEEIYSSVIRDIMQTNQLGTNDPAIFDKLRREILTRQDKESKKLKSVCFAWDQAHKRGRYILPEGMSIMQFMAIELGILKRELWDKSKDSFVSLNKKDDDSNNLVQRQFDHIVFEAKDNQKVMQALALLGPLARASYERAFDILMLQVLSSIIQRRVQSYVRDRNYLVEADEETFQSRLERSMRRIILQRKHHTKIINLPLVHKIIGKDLLDAARDITGRRRKNKTRVFSGYSEYQVSKSTITDNPVVLSAVAAEALTHLKARINYFAPKTQPSMPAEKQKLKHRIIKDGLGIDEKSPKLIPRLNQGQLAAKYEFNPSTVSRIMGKFYAFASSDDKTLAAMKIIVSANSLWLSTRQIKRIFGDPNKKDKKKGARLTQKQDWGQVKLVTDTRTESNAILIPITTSYADTLKEYFSSRHIRQQPELKHVQEEGFSSYEIRSQDNIQEYTPQTNNRPITTRGLQPVQGILKSKFHRKNLSHRISTASA